MWSRTPTAFLPALCITGSEGSSPVPSANAAVPDFPCCESGVGADAAAATAGAAAATGTAPSVRKVAMPVPSVKAALPERPCWEPGVAADTAAAPAGVVAGTATRNVAAPEPVVKSAVPGRPADAVVFDDTLFGRRGALQLPGADEKRLTPPPARGGRESGWWAGTPRRRPC